MSKTNPVNSQSSTSGSEAEGKDPSSITEAFLDETVFGTPPSISLQQPVFTQPKPDFVALSKSKSKKKTTSTLLAQTDPYERAGTSAIEDRFYIYENPGDGNGLKDKIFLRLVPGLSPKEVMLCVVDHTGIPKPAGTLLSVSPNGVKLPRHFNPNLGIAAIGGKVCLR